MKKDLDVKTEILLKELKDYSPETYSHSLNVANICDNVAKKMNLSERSIENLHYSALLHDIGKTKIPLSILHKPSKLTPEEFEIIKNHSTYTRDILTENDFPQEIISIAYHHHEKLDGSGYMEHIKEENLGVEDRILAVADIAEALSSKRSYKDGFSLDKTNTILKTSAEAGKIDPEVTDITISQLTENICENEQNQ